MYSPLQNNLQQRFKKIIVTCLINDYICWKLLYVFQYTQFTDVFSVFFCLKMSYFSEISYKHF